MRKPICTDFDGCGSPVSKDLESRAFVLSEEADFPPLVTGAHRLSPISSQETLEADLQKFSSILRRATCFCKLYVLHTRTYLMKPCKAITPLQPAGQTVGLAVDQRCLNRVRRCSKPDSAACESASSLVQFAELANSSCPPLDTRCTGRHERISK